MEFVKNRVREIWDDQSFVSLQMDGVESQLVALEKVAASFSHFIIEHWVPAQAILIDLHNSTCPSCQRAMDWPIIRVWPPSPSDLVGPLWSLSLHQTLDRGKPLPSLVLSPHSSPTPPPAQLHHSSLWEQGKGSKKDQASPYSLTSVGLSVILLRRQQKGSWKR